MAGRDQHVRERPFAVELEAAVDGAHARDATLDEARLPAASLRAPRSACATKSSTVRVVAVGDRLGERPHASRAATPRAPRAPGTTRRGEMPVRLRAHPPLADRLGAPAPHRGRVVVRAEDRDLLRPRSRRAGASRSRRAPRARCRRSHSAWRLLDASRRAAPARSTAGTRRTRRAGRASEMNDAGAITSMIVPNSRSWPKIQTVIGCVFWPNVSATIRSFHVQRNWKIASDAIAGRPSGRISFRKMRISDAPSMRADSRMSFGSPTKKLRNRKIANGSPNAAWKRMIPSDRVEQPERVVEPEHRDQRHLQRHDEQRDHADEEPVATRGSRATRTRSRRARRSRRRASVLPTAMYAVVLQRGEQSLVVEHRVVVRPGREARMREDLPPALRREIRCRQDRRDEEAERRDEPEQRRARSARCAPALSRRSAGVLRAATESCGFGTTMTAAAVAVAIRSPS